MQIRIQGRKLQCIRSTYDPGTKRSSQKVIASFPSYTRSTASFREAEKEAFEALTDDEKVQLTNWLQEKAEKQTQEALIQLPSTFKYYAEKLTEGLKSQGFTPSEAQAESVWECLDALSKQLRKSGYKRPEKASKKAPAKDARQVDMLA